MNKLEKGVIYFLMWLTIASGTGVVVYTVTKFHDGIINFYIGGLL